MGQNQSQPGDNQNNKPEKKKWEPPVPTRVGKKKPNSSSASGTKIPKIFPTTRCKLKLLKNERIQDYLLMEEEFVQNQELLKPAEEKQQEERVRVDDLRGSPMNVGKMEEIIDDDHCIVSTTNGPEYYVSILSFVDKDLLEPNCSVLLHHKVINCSLGHVCCRCVAKRCGSNGFSNESGKGSYRILRRCGRTRVTGPRN
jgi:26S proteasome regulatory subunit T2